MNSKDSIKILIAKKRQLAINKAIDDHCNPLKVPIAKPLTNPITVSPTKIPTSIVMSFISMVIFKY